MIEYNLDTEHSILHVHPNLRSSKTTSSNSRRRSTRTSRQPVVWLASSSKPRRFPDGRVLGQWSTSFALFGIITSASRKSEL